MQKIIILVFTILSLLCTTVLSADYCAKHYLGSTPGVPEIKVIMKPCGPGGRLRCPKDCHRRCKLNIYLEACIRNIPTSTNDARTIAERCAREAVIAATIYSLINSPASALPVAKITFEQCVKRHIQQIGNISLNVKSEKESPCSFSC